MLFFSKPEEVYEFKFVHGIVLDEISSTLDFVNFIDSENARLESLDKRAVWLRLNILKNVIRKK